MLASWLETIHSRQGARGARVAASTALALVLATAGPAAAQLDPSSQQIGRLLERDAKSGSALATGDFNGDGRPDIVTGEPSSAPGPK